MFSNKTRPIPLAPWIAVFFIVSIVGGDRAMAQSTALHAGKAERKSHGDDQEHQPAAPDVPDEKTIVLFDGRSMDGWEITNFGGEGDCHVDDGKLVIEAGYPISGVSCTRDDLPLTNYEITLEARKTEGIDFFCGLTFPVEDSHCTFIVGGWAGVIVGLSCIDEKDASDNDTRKLMKFEKNRWYEIRVRVQPKQIQCWIDGEQVVQQPLEGHSVSLRAEVLPSRPLGLCNFETTSEFRNIRLKMLPANSDNLEDAETADSSDKPDRETTQQDQLGK